MTWAATIPHGVKLHAIPVWQTGRAVPQQAVCGKRAKYGWTIGTTLTEKCASCLIHLKRDK